jgi:SAM-dependent methyltransferase
MNGYAMKQGKFARNALRVYIHLPNHYSMYEVLTPEKDPLGQALLAYMEGKGDAAIKVYPDVGEPDVIPASYLMRKAADWPELERRAVDACQGHVLDIGAGAGSHALVLQHRGLEVTALDISPGAVETMRLRGVKRALLRNSWTFSGEKYDTLLMMMNGIGIVGDIDGLIDFLEHLKQLLAPGGQILLDSSDIAYLFDEVGASLPAWTGKDDYYGCVMFYMRYETVVGEQFPWLYIHYPLLEQIAGEIGYEIRKIYEDDHYHYLAQLRI